MLAMYENAVDDGEEEAAYDPNNDDRIECPTCGRKFVEEALVKHQKVCKKVFVQKRKVFDIKKVRQEQILAEAREAGGPIGDTYSSYGAKPKAGAAASKKNERAIGGTGAAGNKNKWKMQSEMFRNAMKAARGADAGGSVGNAQAAAAQQAMEQLDDRTECKWCNRKFNEQAADRHIPLCEKKYKE